LRPAAVRGKAVGAKGEAERSRCPRSASCSASAAIDDSFARTRAKGMARIVKYVASVEQHGGAYAVRELDDAAALLGRHVSSVGEARDAIAAAVRSGAVADVDYLRYLWRRTARDNELMRVASGVLADRHWPELR
jgi:hypothetical protein